MHDFELKIGTRGLITSHGYEFICGDYTEMFVDGKRISETSAQDNEGEDFLGKLAEFFHMVGTPPGVSVDKHQIHINQLAWEALEINEDPELVIGAILNCLAKVTAQGTDATLLQDLHTFISSVLTLQDDSDYATLTGQAECLLLRLENNPSTNKNNVP